jgi:hypothetical protein
MKRSVPKRNKGNLRLYVLLTFLLFFSLLSFDLSAQYIFYDNCEQLPQTGWGMDHTKGYAMATGGSQNVNNPDQRTNMTLSTQYARKGGKSYRMHVEKRTDYPGCCEWVRSEVMWMSPNQQTRNNEYRFAAVSILIDPSFQFENRPTQIGFDTKASPDDLQTPFWLGIMNGQYYIDGYFIGGTTYLGAVTKGVWEDWLVERNWTGGSDGFLRFYRNGKLVFEKYGPNYFTRGGDAPIARMQHGLYKWVWATSGGQGWGEGSPVAAANAPMTIYLDEIKFGSPSANINDFFIDQTAGPAPNISPVAQAGANQAITLPTGSVGLSGNGSDADGSVASYAWTKVSGPAGGTIQTPDAAATQITGLVAGTYVFRLTVTDDKGATGSDDVQVVVNASAPAPNAAPQADPGADKTITLPTSSVTLAGRGTDSDGLIADYTWTKVSGPAGGAIQNNDAASTLVTGLIAGTYTYRLTVTDNDGATGSGDVRVIVNAAPAPTPNVAPAANAGPNQVITLPVSSVSVSGAGTDSDGNVASYEWTKVSGPGGGNISSAATASTQITGLTAGTYVFRLTVTDNDGDSDSDDMLVVVNAAAANLPPTAAAGSNITIRLPANAVTLNGSGADADGQIVSYRWTKVSGPNPGNFQSATSQSTGMNNLREGTYVVRLTVTDNDGATATDDITIVVNPAPATPQPPANVAPTANAGANRSITLPVDVVTLNGVGTDVDGTIATFRWSKISGPSAGSLANTTAQSTGVTGLVAGTYVFRLTVTDNDGAQGNDDVQVTVNAAAVPPVNVAPSATAGNDRTVTLPISTVNLNGTAVDPDGSVVSYRWLKVSGPGTGVIQASTSPATSVVSLTEGEYVYRLTVTDNKGAQGSDELKVTVRAAAPLPNQLPVANAGADVSVTLPANTAALSGGRSSDPDGTISSYKWVMVSGPVSGDIANSTTVSPTLSDLVKGEYVFELTVTDNDGASATDRVTVTVAKNNKLPVVQTRDTVTVLLPSQNTELDATLSYDPDGSISSYGWEKKSGPGSPKILSPAGGKTIITDLLQGTYNYEVTVTDNDGDAVKKLVTVLVKNSSARRLIPVVNLYPNPAETNITLTFDAEVDGRSDVTFYDLLGRVVLKDTFMKNSRTFTRRINISSLPAGVYAVEIAIAEAEKVVRKVVKQ